MQVGAALLNVGRARAVALDRRRGEADAASCWRSPPCSPSSPLGYGIGPLLEPWNPYLPVLWWVVVLLAVWSVLDGDVAMLPVAVVAGSFCAQTHLPYLGLAGGLGVLVVAALVLQAPARRPRRPPASPRAGRR